MTQRQIALDASPRSASRARRFLVEALSGTPADGCSDVAALLASELVTNAVLHAQSPVELHVQIDDVVVRVDVHDRLPRLPEPIAGPDTFSGRGLHIVQSLADRWGAEPRPDGGKTVWFELSAR